MTNQSLDYLPTSKEMREAAMRQAWKILTGEADAPAHVMAKAVDLAVRLAASDEEEGPAEETASIFEQIDNLPPERAADLLHAEIKRRGDELLALRVRLEELARPENIILRVDPVLASIPD